MSAYDKVNTVKLPLYFQFIPVYSRLFPFIPVYSRKFPWKVSNFEYSRNFATLMQTDEYMFSQSLIMRSGSMSTLKCYGVDE